MTVMRYVEVKFSKLVSLHFQGLKKPYNPILGEALRCYWKHPKTDSRTFYIAEQVIRFPPVWYYSSSVVLLVPLVYFSVFWFKFNGSSANLIMQKLISLKTFQKDCFVHSFCVSPHLLNVIQFVCYINQFFGLMISIHHVKCFKYLLNDLQKKLRM